MLGFTSQDEAIICSRTVHVKQLEVKDNLSPTPGAANRGIKLAGKGYRARLKRCEKGARYERSAR
jgi:hypothetical protein